MGHLDIIRKVEIPSYILLSAIHASFFLGMLTFEEKNLLHFGLCDVATVNVVLWSLDVATVNVVLWPLDVENIHFLGLRDVATVTIVFGDGSQCY